MNSGPVKNSVLALVYVLDLQGLRVERGDAVRDGHDDRVVRRQRHAADRIASPDRSMANTPSAAPPHFPVVDA